MVMAILQDPLGPKLQGMWDSLADLMSGVADLSPAAGVAGLAMVLVMTIFTAYCFFKLIELMGTVEVGSYWPAKLMGIWTIYRKTTIVYVMVIAATPFAVGMTALARGQVKKPMKDISKAIHDGVGLFGNAMGNAGSFMEYGPFLVSRNSAALHNSFMDTQEQMAKAVMNGLGATAAVADDINRQAAVKVAAAGRGGAVSAALAKTGVQPAVAKAADFHQQAGALAPATTPGFGGFMVLDAKSAYQSLKTIGDHPVASTANILSGGQLETLLFPAVKALACYLIGFGLSLLMLVGLVAGLVTLVKEGFAALSYLAGVSIAMAVGGLLAGAFAPAFALCFLSERTESYGRNFVSFMFSMVFAGFALAIAGSLVSGFMGAAVGVSVGQGLKLWAQGMNEASLGGLAGSCAAAAGCFFAGGMLVSFAGEFLKRAAAIGSGVWAGSFSA